MDMPHMNSSSDGEHTRLKAENQQLRLHLNCKEARMRELFARIADYKVEIRDLQVELAVDQNLCPINTL
jgi:hypothetical protein